MRKQYRDIKKIQRRRNTNKKKTERKKQRKKIKRWIHRVMIKKEIKIKRKRLGHEDWWDRSCTRKKREVNNLGN